MELLITKVIIAMTSFFKRIPVPFEKPNGSQLSRDKLMLTQEGVAYFVKRYKDI